MQIRNYYKDDLNYKPISFRTLKANCVNQYMSHSSNDWNCNYGSRFNAIEHFKCEKKTCPLWKRLKK